MPPARCPPHHPPAASSTPASQHQELSSDQTQGKPASFSGAAAAPETWKYTGGEGGERTPHEVSPPRQQGKKRLSHRPPSLAPDPQTPWKGRGELPRALLAAHTLGSAPSHPLPLLPVRLQPGELTHVLGNGSPNPHLPDSRALLPAPLAPLPAATHTAGQEPTPFSLPPCWAPGNNSASFPARFFNSRLFAFCSFFPPLFRTQLPALLSITAWAPSPSRALPALSARALGDHRSICADNRICFANNILSDVLGSPERGALGETL